MIRTSKMMAALIVSSVISMGTAQAAGYSRYFGYGIGIQQYRQAQQQQVKAQAEQQKAEEAEFKKAQEAEQAAAKKIEDNIKEARRKKAEREKREREAAIAKRKAEQAAKDAAVLSGKSQTSTNSKP